MRVKGKVLTTTLSDSESSSSNSEDSYDGDKNYFAFMAITSMDSKEELEGLKEELGEHTYVEEDEATNDEEEFLVKGDKKLRVMYDALLEDFSNYFKVEKNAVKKMKRIEEDHKATLAQLIYANLNAYSKITLLELEVIQENEKVKCITTKNLTT